MYDSLIRFFKNYQTQVYLTLIFMIVFLFSIKSFLSSILLICIFSYFGVHASRKIQKLTRMSYVISVITFYTLVVLALAIVVTFIIPVFAREGKNLYVAILQGLKEYPQISQYISSYVDELNLIDKINTNWSKILLNGLSAITTVGNIFIRVAVAFFLSLIFTITFPKLQVFGKQFEHSDFPTFFKIVYQLANKFIFILGQIIEVQLIIDIINTILMLIGLTLMGMPSPFVLGLLVFVFGLVPVAGVLISSIPLTLIAFSMGGFKSAIELIILICLMHAFEAYVLHPKLMSSRADLPIFVTFAALIIMEHLLGAWGLIVGVPIVAFLMDVMNIHNFDNKGLTVSQK